MNVAGRSCAIRDDEIVTVSPTDEPAAEAGRVHLLFGLAGSGKSTVARELAVAGAIRFTLDEWMLRLFPELSFDSPTYGDRAEQVKEVIWSVAAQIVTIGSDVVLDWNSWSRRRRSWAVERARPLSAPVILHVLSATVEQASARATARAAAGQPWTHPVSREDNEHLASLMETPADSEGFELVLHDAD